MAHAISAVLAKRFSLSFSQALLMAVSTCAGTSGRLARIDGIGVSVCIFIMANWLAPSNGTFPASISNSMIPREYMSVRRSMLRSAVICSGEK